jgi:NADPH:quinone reductase-like Zn-dependent oxidoreductase
MSAPKTTQQWTIEQGSSSFDSLAFNHSATIPALHEREVLVKFHYASLNYRDMLIAQGMYPFPTTPSCVPGSDGAGEVVAVGPLVSLFKPGDKVITLFNQSHQASPIKARDFMTGLGGSIHGTFRQYGAFDETGLMHMPKTLDYQQASTLSCAALTAWNSLYGLEGKALKPGQYVLVQGTGGVSTFGLQVSDNKSTHEISPQRFPSLHDVDVLLPTQFAKTAGARVIATTSSTAKAESLKKLGADHVLNYKEDPAWGEAAKALTGGVGVDQVIEIGGPNTLGQSLAALKPDGIVTIVGFVAGADGEKQPSFLEALMKHVIVRGVVVGSRVMLEDMNEAIDASGIKPVMDQNVFDLKDIKEGYEYMWKGKHTGKVTVKIQ